MLAVAAGRCVCFARAGGGPCHERGGVGGGPGGGHPGPAPRAAPGTLPRPPARGTPRLLPPGPAHPARLAPHSRCSSQTFVGHTSGASRRGPGADPVLAGVPQVLPPSVSGSFFAATLPGMARLALSLPAALCAQHEAALRSHPRGRHLPLRLLRPQQPGLVMLSQVSHTHRRGAATGLPTYCAQWECDPWPA